MNTVMMSKVFCKTMGDGIAGISIERKVGKPTINAYYSGHIDATRKMEIVH